MDNYKRELMLAILNDTTSITLEELLAKLACMSFQDENDIDPALFIEELKNEDCLENFTGLEWK